MMKYLLSQLTQMCMWVGICVIVSAMFATRGEIMFLGAIMLFLHDDVIKNFITKQAPCVSKWIQEVMDASDL